MMQLIPSIANAWINKKNEINASIKRIENYLIEVNTTKQGENWKEIQASFFIQPHYLIILFAVLLVTHLGHGLTTSPNVE